MHFKNQPHKIKTILSVFRKGEKLSRDEIARRLHNLRFEVSPNHLSYYIKDYMTAFIDKEDKRNGNVLYFLRRRTLKVAKMREVIK